VVTDWNNAALQAIKADRTPPPRASRGLAMLHAAVYDVVNGFDRSFEPYLVKKKAPHTASVEAAVAAAARAVLVQLYPAQQASFDAAYNAAIAAIPANKSRSEGIEWGESVAEAILAARENDGANTVVSYTPGAAPGNWQPTPPAFAPALLPQWPLVKPFAMTSGSQFQPPAPPALGSAMYAFDFNLTKEVGDLNSATRTAEQTTIARFWADGAGTVTPPGHWNVIARELAIRRGLSPAENARLFALLNTAEADAAICAWDAKYADDFWRPVTAIRAADTDGNPATDPNPAWTPLLVTPPFPECTSGHSTFSGAAATVLARFFGSDAIPFATTSEDLPGVTRSFSSFWEAAQEAGISRVYGGIHFMTANHLGLSSGARIGSYVMDSFLAPSKHAK
jgi:membrane-associated phospholipid phosphatase